MNAFTPPRDFSGQPHRAHDVLMVIGRAHRAIGSAIGPYTRRPSRRVRLRMLDVLKAIQLLPTYLDGLATMDVEGALSDASSAIAARDTAVAHQSSTIAGRFAEWRHFRRYPEEYHIVEIAPNPSGKGVGFVISKLLGWNDPIEIHDPKRDPNTRH